MNGASAELCAKTNNKPNSNKTMTIGNSQNFFLARSNNQISDNIENISEFSSSVNRCASPKRCNYWHLWVAYCGNLPCSAGHNDRSIISAMTCAPSGV